MFMEILSYSKDYGIDNMNVLQDKKNSFYINYTKPSLND